MCNIQHLSSWNRLSISKSNGGLGFRELAVFNKALLAKQGWRILTNQDSLVARVFTDIYFPSGDFKAMGVGCRPSYAWRSICQAREMLKLGVGWLVGNGESIKIWGDAWLPSPYPRLLLPPHPDLDTNSKVATLIDQYTGWRNYEMLSHYFDLGEVARFGSVLISPLMKPDRVVWHGTSSRIFTVRNAYHLYMVKRTQAKGESSRGAEVDPLWNQIWSLQVPPVVRQFCWSVCNNVLPVTQICSHGKLLLVRIAPYVFRNQKQWYIAYGSCPSAMAVWQEGSRHIQKLALGANDGMELIRQLFAKLSIEEVGEALVTARLIWLRRNKAVF